MKRRTITYLTAGFTIVELLVVIAVIGILAALVIVAFNGVQQSAAASVLQGDLKSAQTQLELVKVDAGTYPEVADDLQPSDGTTLEYISDGTSFCATASSTVAKTSYFLDSDTNIIEQGTCPGHIGYSDVPPVANITAGYNHSCAVTNEQIYCWGVNNFGQIGNNDTANAAIPTAVSTAGVLAEKAVLAAAGSDARSCAVADGQAYCWGTNGINGQLGNNSQTNSLLPVAVTHSGALVGKTVSSLSAGRYHTCVNADGGVFCWGTNTNGQLGTGNTTRSRVPIAVSTAGVLAGKTVTHLSGGAGHTCAVASGEVFCWGANSSGQLGDGTTTQSLLPLAVDVTGVLAGKTVTKVATNTHTCVIANGQVFCWGWNNYGQLGRNNTIDSSVPVAVTTTGVLAGKTITDIAAGGGHTCVVADGQAFCWGWNDYGQLGNDDDADEYDPVAVDTGGVLAGKTVTAVTTGYNHTCAIADGQAYCWGRNFAGQLGDGTTSDSWVPVEVSALP